MLLFDIGANRGDATVAGLALGFDKVIAVEPAPRMFAQLVSHFLYDNRITPLKFAVSDTLGDQIEFYEADEDGLSTTNIDWLTAEGMPYNDKPFRTVEATTCTIDWLVEQYGEPTLIKIDVEGAEWAVFRGITKKYRLITFEWTDVTLAEHCKQLDYLKSLGYTDFAPQFIVNHLDEPMEWFSLESHRLDNWVKSHKAHWEKTGWKTANLRPTGDVGMCWVR